MHLFTRNAFFNAETTTKKKVDAVKYRKIAKNYKKPVKS